MVALYHAASQPATERPIDMAERLGEYDAEEQYPHIADQSARIMTGFGSLRYLEDRYPSLARYGEWFNDATTPTVELPDLSDEEITIVRDFPHGYSHSYALHVQAMQADEITAAHRRGDYAGMVATAARTEEFAAAGLEVILHLLLEAEGVSSALIDALLEAAF